FLSNERVMGDRNKVYVMGYSAGGELAANLVFNNYFHEKYGIDKHVFKKIHIYIWSAKFQSVY
ncbi:hypothetical protein, partial [Paraclostridium bifermentans]|uniref:hypothetical protein n=1 Tax=Paraclostridium bifermentans TaxID=1490 RepID=UPI002FCCEA6E